MAVPSLYEHCDGEEMKENDIKISVLIPMYNGGSETDFLPPIFLRTNVLFIILGTPLSGEPLTVCLKMTYVIS